MSLPLYEGVDWNIDRCLYHQIRNVSLFTREWIEMTSSPNQWYPVRSPSLRGSGLKSSVNVFTIDKWCCLPLYEGVDWNIVIIAIAFITICLPLYEGVDWNLFCLQLLCKLYESPSLRGSGLKSPRGVYLLTKPRRLPLYEGVDWNKIRSPQPIPHNRLPLYEGVDWNHDYIIRHFGRYVVSLFTREWIEISSTWRLISRLPSPSLRGSGLKWKWWNRTDDSNLSPSLRGSGLKWYL